jgi:cation diffusion facilitator family transporter
MPSHSPKQRAAAISIASNATLVVLKLVVGIISGSVSILSEAIHSANDLLASAIAYMSVRVADKPPDQEHTFGHGKAESISGAIEAALIMIAALWIVVEAGRKLFRGGEVAQLDLGVIVMGFSALLNAGVSRYLFRVARREDSLALEADANHLSTDVLTSLGVCLGLVVVKFTGWYILDPIVAIGVAVFIGNIGWRLTRNAGKHLMDSSLPPEEVQQIEAVLNSEPRILSWHRLRTRKSGSDRHVDMHIVVGEETLLADAHRIAVGIEHGIMGVLPHAQVIVHVDPHTDED